MPATLEAKTPHLITALPGPKAKRVIEADAQSVSPSYTRDYPLVAKRGHGAMVEDVDGNTFLDFAAGIAVCSTGHCHPEVVAAIQKQAAELIHMSGTDFYYPSLVELAQKLGAVAPGKEPKRVYFGNSGAEAIEAAIKLAKYHTTARFMAAPWALFRSPPAGPCRGRASGRCFPASFTCHIRTPIAARTESGRSALPRIV
jgi:4-aminobutyrate aminotransferase